MDRVGWGPLLILEHGRRQGACSQAWTTEPTPSVSTRRRNARRCYLKRTRVSRPSRRTPRSYRKTNNGEHVHHSTTTLEVTQPPFPGNTPIRMEDTKQRKRKTNDLKKGSDKHSPHDAARRADLDLISLLEGNLLVGIACLDAVHERLQLRPHVLRARARVIALSLWLCHVVVMA